MRHHALVSPTSRHVLLLALAAAAGLVGVELMITAVALPEILRDPAFADYTDLRRASWVVNGYLVAYIAVMPLAGRAADRFGLPRLIGLALLVFALGSGASGAAQTLDQLIAARILQGVGGGAIVPLATAAASHLYVGAGRARALGIVGAFTFLGMAIGPFAGAAVLEQLDLGAALARSGTEWRFLTDVLAPAWRWLFYLSVPLSLVVLVYIWAASVAWPRASGSHRLDLVGAALFTTALAAGLLALTQVGTDSTNSALPPELVVGIAVAATAVTVLYLARARDPFLDGRLLRSLPFSGAVLLSLLTGYALATAIVGGAVFVDRVRYGGPDEQRLALGALAGAMALGALGSGLLLRVLGVVLMSLAGLAIGVAGLWLLGGAGPDTPLEQVAVALAMFGLGFGMTVTPRSVAAAEALGRGAFGMAAAGVTVARMIGMAVGLAVLTALGSRGIETLSAVLVDPEARDAVLPSELRGRPLEDGLVVEALEAWAAGEAAAILGELFLIAAVVMVAAVLPTLAMRARRRPPIHSDEPSEVGRDREQPQAEKGAPASSF
ncbi:MDR family MFS transporter [soil metagenome]